jgi:hypothetical protein
MPQPQSFKNHAKFDPSFHFFLAPVALLMVIGTIVECVRNPSWMAAAHILVALWALVATFKIRLYALKVQDRVIRLEERLRFERVLPPDLKPRIAEFTVAQLVGLRFASDAELPGLARKVLDEKIAKRKAIKQMVKTWKPDYLRA